ncbi:MAG: type II toxin-antitoxin system VapB family antitoxin [Armatimonadetes bacterium]|nr:type II toxin-antitoxin system VapB family antitoxin [Armatimonadota bacterium]
MRSTIDLPDSLLTDAMELTGLKTKREVVTLALEELVRKRRLDDLRSMFGKGFGLTQEDLEEMRRDEYDDAPTAAPTPERAAS